MAKGEARGNKRKFHGPTPPRRGPPAIFVTCEAGRERKCQREILELLHHYYYASRPSLKEEAHSNEEKNTHAEDDEDPSDEKPLSLEEEVAMLRKGAAAEEVLLYDPNSKRPRNDTSKNSSMKSPFSIYDTGLRGTVSILCTLPDCEMVPYGDILAEIRAAKEKASNDATTNNAATGDDVESKEKGDENGTVSKVSNEDEGKRSEPKQIADPPLWDPIQTVKCILQDAKLMNKAGSDTNNDSTTDEKKDTEQEEDGKKEAPVSKEMLASPPPGSRFILRILPMQATCFASVEEIKAVSISLLKRFLPKCQAILSKDDGKELTFKLEIKRRLCGHLKRDQVLEAVTPFVMGGMEEEMPGYKFSVNLSDPDFSIRIETCKSLCGISILPREEWYKNFNLAELTNPTLDADGK